MRRLFNRAAALALSVAVTLGAAAPCAASDAGTTKGSTLTKLSPASRQVLAKATPGPTAQTQAQTPAPSASFFKTTRGKVTLALMGAGVGLTIWSINHDRKPVKSPIR